MVNRPYTTDGLPLPNILEWNSLVEQIQAIVSKNSKGRQPPVLKGSVEDLVSPDCHNCGSELIRQSMGGNAFFTAGVIYCFKGIFDQNHSQEYWAEVWPVAKTEKSIWNCFSDQELKAAMQEQSAANYRLSNPLIKRCFDYDGIWWHQHLGLGGTDGDFGVTYYERPRTKGLPKPAFMHK